MKFVLFLLTAVFAAASTAPVTLAPIPSLFSGSLSVDAVSQYVFRGVKLDGESLQPAANLQIGSVYANVWANQSLRASDREVDLTLGGNLPLGFDLGVTAFTYSNDAKTTYEPYLGWSYEVSDRLKAAVYGLYDLTLHVTTVEGRITSRMMTVNRADISLEGSIGRLKGRDITTYTYWGLGPVVKFPLGENLSLSAALQYVSNDSDFKRNLWVGKLGVALSF